jgi:hypothetical protein
MLLAKPYHPIIPLKGYHWSVEIQGAVEGTILADVNHDGQPIEIDCVRIFGRRLDKYSANTYWDVTSVVLATMLEALLRTGALVNRSLTISTVGRANTGETRSQSALFPRNGGPIS